MLTSFEGVSLVRPMETTLQHDQSEDREKPWNRQAVRERQTDTDKQTERERERERWLIDCNDQYFIHHDVPSVWKQQIVRFGLAL
jgi:hypothetical protein